MKSGKNQGRDHERNLRRNPKKKKQGKLPKVSQNKSQEESPD